MADPGSAERSSTAGGSEGGRSFGGSSRGGRRGGRRGGSREGGEKKEEWHPTTKLGRLVKSGRVTKMDQIYRFSLPVKEYQVIDFFLKDLKDEVIKIMPVQKQTPSGQRTRFKAFVVVGDRAGHIGLGVKCSKEVATAIRGGINAAKLSVIPVRLGYWGNKIGNPHTVPSKVTGKCGSVRVRLIPAPRGTGIVAASTPAKLLGFAGVGDVYSKTCGHTKTIGNFAIATFNAIQKTYEYQTPDLWKVEKYELDPFGLFSADLQTLAAEGKKDEQRRANRLEEGEGEGGGRGRGEGRRFAGGRFGGDGDARGGRFGDRGDRGGRYGGGEGGGEGRRYGGGSDRGSEGGEGGGEGRRYGGGDRGRFNDRGGDRGGRSFGGDRGGEGGGERSRFSTGGDRWRGGERRSETGATPASQAGAAGAGQES